MPDPELPLISLQGFRPLWPPPVPCCTLCLQLFPFGHLPPALFHSSCLGWPRCCPVSASALRAWFILCPFVLQQQQQMPRSSQEEKDEKEKEKEKEGEKEEDKQETENDKEELTK